MIHKPISYFDVQKNPKNYNTNNLHEFDPYLYVSSEKTLYIDSNWWTKTLSEPAKNMIVERIGKLDIDITINHKYLVETPHSYEKSDAELIVYRAYIDSHDFHVWFPMVQKLHAPPALCVPGLENTHLIKLTLEEKQNLAHLACKRMKKAKPINQDDIALLQSLQVKLAQYLDGQTEWFMRLSGTSGKNEVSVEPITTYDMLLRKLISNILFLHQEYEREDKETFIVLKPWNDEIQKPKEFRVFFCNGKITGVSQQYWQRVVSFREEDLETIAYAIENATFLKLAPYPSFVADVWISFREKKCYLIEYNPFGAHCGAGSSLFEWQKDYNQLYGHTNFAELRFTSVLI